MCIVLHLAFEFSQDWLCKQHEGTEHRLLVPSIVEDECSWYEIKQTLNGMWFPLEDLKDVSEITRFLFNNGTFLASCKQYRVTNEN